MIDERITSLTAIEFASISIDNSHRFDHQTADGVQFHVQLTPVASLEIESISI
jgi:hypothetical protein